MTTTGPRRIRLDGPANFRDVGGYPAADGRRLRYGRVFRSDSLSHLTDADVRRIARELGVVTVVDLRARNEVETFGHGPLADHGVAVHHLPIVDETRRERVEDRVTGTTDAGDAADADVGGAVQPAEAMELDRIYPIMLERFGDRFASVVRVVADPAHQPVVFHCAAGKDRTGLVAALLLSALGVDDDTVAADYALTAEHMDELLARHRSRAAENEMPEVAESLFAAEASVMHTVLDWLRAQHGSAEQYLLDHGLEPATLSLMRSSLLE